MTTLNIFKDSGFVVHRKNCKRRITANVMLVDAQITRVVCPLTVQTVATDDYTTAAADVVRNYFKQRLSIMAPHFPDELPFRVVVDLVSDTTIAH